MNHAERLIVERKLSLLKQSSFRSRFHLSDKDIAYIEMKGMDVIREHAFYFVKQRLSCLCENDGKQTPMKGHPVFIAQHATGTCCRGCLEKWHKIPKDKVLSYDEEDYIVDVIMAWIECDYKKS